MEEIILIECYLIIYLSKMIKKNYPKKEIIINRISDLKNCENLKCFNNADYTIIISNQIYNLCSDCINVISEKLYKRDETTQQTKL